MEGYFFTDGFVIALVDADLMLGDYADELYFHVKIVSELDEFEAVPKSPDVLSHLMLRVNRISWHGGVLANEHFKGMDWRFEIYNTVTKETVAKGFARNKGDTSPVDYFKTHVNADLPVGIRYDY